MCCLSALEIYRVVLPDPVLASALAPFRVPVSIPLPFLSSAFSPIVSPPSVPFYTSAAEVNLCFTGFKFFMAKSTANSINSAKGGFEFLWALRFLIRLSFAVNSFVATKVC